MATKQMGAAASGTTDLVRQADLTAAASTGLTGSAGALSVNLPVRTVPIAFHVPGTITTGVKTPEFICPVTGTIDAMRGRCSSGASATYRLVKNGATNLTTSASTGTTVVTTSNLATAVVAGDRIQLEVVAAGTGVNLSVTGTIVVT